MQKTKTKLIKRQMELAKRKEYIEVEGIAYPAQYNTIEEFVNSKEFKRISDRLYELEMAEAKREFKQLREVSKSLKEKQVSQERYHFEMECAEKQLPTPYNYDSNADLIIYK